MTQQYTVTNFRQMKLDPERIKKWHKQAREWAEKVKKENPEPKRDRPPGFDPDDNSKYFFKPW